MTNESRYLPALGRTSLAPFYDMIVGMTTRERRVKKALIEQANLSPGCRVLDLATGTGTLAILMNQGQPTLKLSALDGDATILARAASKAIAARVEVEWIHALSFALPFQAAYFDRIVSSHFFHHLTWGDKVRTVREALRVLRPSGELHEAD